MPIWEVVQDFVRDNHPFFCGQKITHNGYPDRDLLEHTKPADAAANHWLGYVKLRRKNPQLPARPWSGRRGEFEFPTDLPLPPGIDRPSYAPLPERDERPRYRTKQVCCVGPVLYEGGVEITLDRWPTADLEPINSSAQRIVEFMARNRSWIHSDIPWPFRDGAVALPDLGAPDVQAAA
jgi:hypothetical protein